MNKPARLTFRAEAVLGELEAWLWARAQLSVAMGESAILPHLALVPEARSPEMKQVARTALYYQKSEKRFVGHTQVRPPELAHASELHGFLLLGLGHDVRSKLRLLSSLRKLGQSLMPAAAEESKC